MAIVANHLKTILIFDLPLILVLTFYVTIHFLLLAARASGAKN
jgi:hypothetical protein